MVYQKRGGATPNTIKLTLDFRTFDKLQAVAKARKQPSDRCAYELLQQVLDTIETPTAAPLTAVETPDFSPNVTRAIEEMRNYKPKGSA